MEYSEQLHDNKFDNLRWNGQIPWKTQTTKVHPEDLDNLTSPTSIKRMDFVVKTLHTNKRKLQSSGRKKKQYQYLGKYNRPEVGTLFL